MYSFPGIRPLSAGCGQKHAADGTFHEIDSRTWVQEVGVRSINLHNMGTLSVFGFDLLRSRGCVGVPSF